jgi:serine/threonine protein kinase/HAMP domain-containing protein
VLLAVGISFVIVGQLVGRLAKPLLDLASSMSKVGKGDLEVTAPIAGPTEIQDAAKAFNQMIDSLRQKDTLQALVNRLEEIRKSADVTDPLVRDQAQFGKYVVARKLGGGGMATVYVGLPIETLKEDDKVALKVIHREFAGNEEYQSRFKREYEVMLSLQHPGLIRVIDAGSLNGLLYIVMEYVEGKTLADHLEGKPGMPVRDFLGLVMPLLEAMHHSHEKGIVHRDLKPENLMLTPVGIKVMDFGLAMGGDMSRITQSGSAIGTPRYMSPEQINGQVCDGRCDQYALGIMFYEMLAGRCPFDGNDVLAIVFQHLSQTPQSLSVHRTDLPAPIVDAVARMLSKDPHLRFNSLLEIRDIFSKLIT